MSAVADKLREARALIERGWTQGSYRKGRCVCALGAINKATGGSAMTEGRNGWVAVTALLCRAINKSSSMWLTEWNDRPGRTQAEVLTAFDKAIELAEAQDA